MAVRITKPAVNFREKLAELERPIGVNGAALMATSTPQDAFSLIGAGRRNILINGNHIINQRGLLPKTGITANGYEATDRWKTYRNNVTADASVSSVTLPNGVITNALKATATSTSSTGILDWYQCVEDVNYNPTKGQWVTLSGWIRSNNPNAKLFLWGGSAARQGYLSHSGNGQWEYLSFSCIVSTSINNLEAYAAIGDNVGLNGVQITSGDYVEFALMQLELGKVATPFEYRAYGQELAFCQRYYFDLRPSSGVSVYPTVVESSGTDRWYAVIKLPVTMRTTPTLYSPGTYTGTSNMRLNWPFPGSTTLSAITGLYFVSPDAFTLYGTKSSSFAGAGNMVGLEISSALSSTIGANAEI